MPTLRLALVQANPTVGDLTGNMGKAIDGVAAAAAQGAGDAAAEPDAMFSEWVIFFLEEVVEGHRVVNFGRMEFEQFSDFNDGFAGDSAEGVVDEVQSGQGNSAFIGVFREFRFDFLTEFFRESAHGLPAGMW